MPELVGDDFSGPPPKFDFEAMGVLDGRVYYFRKGEDYDSSEANFRLHLTKYTKDRGLRYESRSVKDRASGEVLGMEVRFLADPQSPAPRQESAQGEAAAPAPASTNSQPATASDAHPGQPSQEPQTSPESGIPERERPSGTLGQ